MPVYEYVCKECGDPLEVRATIAEYTEGLRPQCKKCGSNDLVRVLSSVGILKGSSARRPACGPGGGGAGCCG